MRRQEHDDVYLASAECVRDTPLILAPESERSVGLVAFLNALDAEFETVRHLSRSPSGFLKTKDSSQ